MSSKIIEFSMVTVWDWFVQLLALFLIIYILYKLLFKPVTEFLEKRQALIASDMQQAETAKTSANTLKAEYEQKIAHIEDERDTILKDARAKALKNEEQIIASAHEEADAIKAKALRDIALEQERVQAEIKTQMIEVANLMASKFVAESMNEDKQNQLVDEMIKEMGDVEWLG